MADSNQMDRQTIQSLPRELGLHADGSLSISPLRELETLRQLPGTQLANITVGAESLTTEVFRDGAPPGEVIASLPGDAVEIRIVVAREQAERKLFGFSLFSDGSGGGLPVVLRPETGGLRLGSSEAPFSLADLPAGEDLELRIFIDKHVVEIFANDRQAILSNHCE